MKENIKTNSNSKFALTTFDNPFSPFTEFIKWYAFDTNKARMESSADCSSVLARMAYVSDEMSDEQYNNELERAIDEIVKYDMTNQYVKAVNPDYVEQ